MLYRKYRSRSFNEVVGQEHVTALLRNAVKKGTLAHAYLFVGSRGTGKTSTARILAKAVNCENASKTGEPCNKCDSCRIIEAGGYLDIIEIDAASNRGIDRIRELKERIEFQPAIGRFKVYIVDEVHMLTLPAFNALLKTLEEPPEHVIFILATTEPYRLPATILSRCQRYDFRLGTDEQIRSVLQGILKSEKIKIEDDALEILVSSAQGSYRDALSLLEVVANGEGGRKKITAELIRSILGMPSGVMVVEFLSLLVEGDVLKAMSLIQELESRGINLQQFMQYTIELLRKVLVGKVSGKLDETQYPFVANLSIKSVLTIINEFLEAERKLRYAAIPAIVLEILVPTIIDLLGTGELDSGDSMGNNGRGKDGDSSGDSSNDKGNGGNKKTKTSKSSKRKSYKKAKKVVRRVVKKELKSVVSGADAVTYQEIQKNWDKIAAHVKEVNGHLYAVIKSATLKSMDDGVLRIVVKFMFHKERLECTNGRLLLSAAFQHVLGMSVQYKCTVNGTKVAHEDVVSNNVPEWFGRKVKKVHSDAVVKLGQKSKPGPLSDSGVTSDDFSQSGVDQIFAGF